MDEINEDRVADIVEQQLRFLRGEGPAPALDTVAESERIDVAAILDLVDALAASSPPSPPLEEDRVAASLGLLPPKRQQTEDAKVDPVMTSARELSHRLGRMLAVEEPIAKLEGQFDDAQPVAVCRSLVEVVLVVVHESSDDLETTSLARRLFETRPEFSAIAFSSVDATRATVVTYGRSIDHLVPATGWASPGELEWEPLGIALGRHFERAMPRWDEIAALPPGDLLDDLALEARGVVNDELARVRKTRPQLSHKQQARDFVAGTDADAFLSWIDSIRSGRASGEDVVTQASVLCRSGSS